jgi:hypothetical protein
MYVIPSEHPMITNEYLSTKAKHMGSADKVISVASLAY